MSAKDVKSPLVPNPVAGSTKSSGSGGEMKEPPIPQFNEYLPPIVRSALLEKWSVSVKGVPGLRLVTDLNGQSPQLKWPDVLTEDALAFMVELYRRSLTFPSPNSLNAVLAHRKMKRASIAAAARSAVAATRSGAATPALKDVRLADGSIALGFRSDTAQLRENPDWRVSKHTGSDSTIPAKYNRFQDTMTGPPTPQALVSALTSGISFYMADFEDSNTVALESLLDGMRWVTAANTGKLDFTDRDSKRYSLAGVETTTEVSVRFEGLHLPNAHFLVDGYAVPAHLVTIALYLWHNWAPLKQRGSAPVFYIPKLERMEEGGYMNLLYGEAERLLQSRVGVSQYRVGTIVTYVIIENALAVFEQEELLYALKEYAAGCNTGWHDYMASIGALFGGEIPTFHMPPKSNLTIVRDYLEAYQVGIVSVCKKRGALPIGGMSGMVPPLHMSDDKEVELVEGKIREQFTADFWSQVNRGMEGVWLAHPPLAKLAQTLIADWKQKLPLPEYVPAKPITHDSILVWSLQPKDTIVTEADFHRNISDALQYTASYLLGNGNVALTRPTVNAAGQSLSVRLLDDAATLERSRREIAAILKWGKPIRVSDKATVPVTESYLKISMTKVFNTIKSAGPHPGAVPGVDITFHRETKNCYDAAFAIVTDLFMAPVSVDYFTVYALRHLIYPFRSDASALTKVEAYDSYPFLRKYSNLSLSAIKSIDFVSNEAFAPAASLFRAGFPLFAPHTFGAQGQVYDGWETARHNISPPDVVEFTLTAPAKIYGANIDTAHFDGNHAIGTGLQALVIQKLDHQRIEQKWVDLVDKSLVKPTARNFFHTNLVGGETPTVQRLRLLMYPDGGIARLELYGELIDTAGSGGSGGAAKEVVHDSSVTSVETGVGSDRRLQWIANLPFRNGFGADFKLDAVVDVRPPPVIKKPGTAAATEQHTYPPPPPAAYSFPELIDFAAVSGGGSVLASSSSHYSLPSNMIKPNRAINMGDGWETKRMRVETAAAKATAAADAKRADTCVAVPPTPQTIFDLTGPVTTHYNWTVFALSGAANAMKIVLDTLHFRNNPPVAFSLEGCSTTAMNGVNFYSPAHKWYTLLPPTNLKPHAEHVFDVRDPVGCTTHVLLKIYPCGGVSRIRVLGERSKTLPAASSKL